MSNLIITDDLFFAKAGLHKKRVEGIVDRALHASDDGELFLEYSQLESISWDDGRVKSASYNTSQGFGLRAVTGEVTGYAHAADLSEAAMERAAQTVQSIHQGQGGTMGAVPRGTNRLLYSSDNPIESTPFNSKVALMAQIDAYVRAKDPRVKQVMVSVANEWRAIQIIRAGGHHLADVRPLVRLNIGVTVEANGRTEVAHTGAGGRTSFDMYMTPEKWKAQVDQVLQRALTNLEAAPSPAGEMPIVLGPGWPGMLFHEAVGHGLEGDFNRKKTSAFSGRIGERVAAPGVTVVDDGTLENRRGSITIDDEGTPSQCTTLIEDGILVGYLQDRLNARLMGVPPTGNGRRESYAHPPMPRMTNTFMRPGAHMKEEIIQSVKRGIYALEFGGGSVDITSGKFVFSATEAYLIENGKITAPIKGVTIVGNGPDALTKITMIGNDLELDAGIGTCGKDGQWVPVGVGQPTLRIDGLTVGGTAV